MSNDKDPQSSNQQQDRLLDHSYDGIQEYDNRLPNWWLYTLYGAIMFAVAYWFFFFHALPGNSNVEDLKKQLAEIDAAKLKAMASIDDAALWKMSRIPEFVEAGKATFNANCVACHGVDLKGGIGANLVSGKWIHGSNPMDHMKLIQQGFAPKGMPPWGPILGDKKITEVVAYILSHHQPLEGIGQ